jgi:hypothetical protein
MSDQDRPDNEGRTYGKAGGYNVEPGESVGGFDETQGGGAVQESGEYTGQTGTGYGRLPGSEGASLRDEVERRLKEDPFLDASEILILAEGDEIVLEGVVAAKADVQRAEHLAKSTPGVDRVRAKLSVRESPAG